MKRKISLIFTLVLTMSILLIGMFSVTASAATTASGTCGTSAAWNLDSNGTLTISGTGPMASYSYSSTPWQIGYGN